MDELTELLRSFDIKFSDNVNDFLKCTICKNVLVDSCFSPCACKFCSCCIKDYLRDGGRPCPGGKDDCEETFLNTFSELLKDQLSNMQISYLSVACPNENCDHRCQLKKLPEHMRMCSKSAVRCVFSYVGCADGCVSINKMKEHLEERSVAHGLALVAHMRNMDNEMKERMDRYERSLESLTTENAMLRQMTETNVAEIEAIKQEMRLLSSKEETLTHENAALKEELEAGRLRQEMFQTEMPKIMEEIRKLTSNQEMLALKNASLKGELEASRDEVATLRQRLNECETKLMADTAEKVRQNYEAIATGSTKMKILKSLTNVKNDKSELVDAADDLRQLLDENKKELEAVRLVQTDVASRPDKLDAMLRLESFVSPVQGIKEKHDNEYNLCNEYEDEDDIECNQYNHGNECNEYENNNEYLHGNECNEYEHGNEYLHDNECNEYEHGNEYLHDNECNEYEHNNEYLHDNECNEYEHNNEYLHDNECNEYEHGNDYEHHIECNEYEHDNQFNDYNEYDAYDYYNEYEEYNECYDYIDY